MRNIHNPSREDFQNLLSNGHKNLIIFKYSSICPISSAAENEYDNWLDQNDDITSIKINVRTNKDLSRFVEENFNIKHESPQLIWIDEKSEVKWHGSHFDIKAKTLNSLK